MIRRTTAEVRAEPMLFSCDLHHARLLGGVITRDFLARVSESFPEFRGGGSIIDTRVHMLMPGFYPAIPGWHHDDVPRTGPPNAAGVPQPNYAQPSVADHVAAFIAGDDDEGESLTEYALGDAPFSDPVAGETVYCQWAPEVDAAIDARLLDRAFAYNRELIQFTDRTWHRASPATGPCWRWFGRISSGTDRSPKNEVRSQVQAYVASLAVGW